MDQIASKAFVSWAEPKEGKGNNVEYFKVPIIYVIVAPDGKQFIGLRNFNYGFTLNQDNSGNAEIYLAANKTIELTGGLHGHMELTRGTANLTLGGEVFPGGGVSGSAVS